MPSAARTSRPLVLATSNPDKVREIRAILAGESVHLLTLADFPPTPEPDESGPSFEANARIKAVAYAQALRPRLGGALVVAEDSGLEVDGLGGAPGVLSARYLGAEATYADRFDAILRGLASTPDKGRAARFVCALAVSDGEGRVCFESRGTVEGQIAEQPSGDEGFGYDPIFYYPPYRATFASMSEAQKRAVAHRGQAFRLLAHWMSAQGA